MWPDLLAASALLTLAIYQFMVFWGRKKDLEERFNLYFAVFAFATSLFIISPYFRQQFFLYAFKPHWLYAINIEMFSVWLLMCSSIKFLNCLLKISSPYKKYLRFSYVTLSLCLILTLTSNFISLEFYFKHILFYLLIIVAINVIIINSLYGFWIKKGKLYNETYVKVLYFGYLFMSINILIYRLIELTITSRLLIPNHYITALLLLIFAYSLSAKANKEHKELRDLKVNIEKGLLEKTDRLMPHSQMLRDNSKKINPSDIQVNNMDEQFLQKAVQIIEKNILETSFSTEQFSKEIGMSRVHLHRRLKTLTGQSATEFIHSIRLKRAAYLLKQRSGTVSEIAYISGYNNLSYFTRCFKAQYGVTPSEYSSHATITLEAETI